MGNSYFFLAGLVLTLAVGLLILAYQTWQRRSTLGAGMLTLLLLAVSWWCIANAIETLAIALPVKLFWARMKYFGIVPIAPATLAFVLQYTRRAYWLRREYVFPVLIIPAITWIALWSDPWHHLFYSTTNLVMIAGHPFLRTGHGLFFWLHTLYSYAMLLVAVALMAISALQSSPPYRTRHWMIAIAALVPLMANLITILNLNPIPVMDITPLAFSITGLVIYLAAFKLRMLDVKPIARQTVVENMQDGVLVLDLDNRIVDINPALERWLGKKPAQVLGCRLDAVFPDSIAELLADNREVIQESGEAPSLENSAVVEIETRFQGQVQTLEARSSPIYDRTREAAGRLLLLQDVTGRKTAEEERRQSEVRFQTLVVSMDDLVFTLDRQGRYSGAFGRWAERIGIGHQEVVGKTAIELLGEEAGLIHAQAHRRALLGDPVVYEWSLPSPAGTRYYQVSLSPVRDGEDVVGVVGVGREITGLKELERDLEEAKVLLEQAFEQSPVPIVLLSNPGGIIAMMNPACEVTLKVPDPSRLIGVPIAQAKLNWEVAEPDGRAIPRARWPLALALRGETVNNVEYLLIFDDGSSRWMLINATPVLNKSGAQIAVVMVFVDITERRRMEQADREQRILAEAYRDNAAILNSTIQLDAVLTLVLTNIELVVAHDAASVVFFDQEGAVDRSRFRGYIGDERDMALELCRKVMEMADWRQNPTRPTPLIIADIAQDRMWKGRVNFSRLRSFLNVPIHFKDRVTGIIMLASAVPNFYASVHGERLQVFANQAALAIENARLYSEVQHLTLTDELTRIYNYRGLLELGQREYDRARRFDRPLSVLFYDIDHFREFNNQYSHDVGNQVLQATAKIARGCLRGVDIIARYGGEEFVVLLPETQLEAAVQVAERIRQEVAETYVLTRYGRLSITVSVGAAEMTGENSLLSLIDKANQAEHRAKEEGRNRVAASGGGDQRLD